MLSTSFPIEMRGRINTGRVRDLFYLYMNSPLEYMEEALQKRGLSLPDGEFSFFFDRIKGFDIPLFEGTKGYRVGFTKETRFPLRLTRESDIGYKDIPKEISCGYSATILLRTLTLFVEGLPPYYTEEEWAARAIWVLRRCLDMEVYKDKEDYIKNLAVKIFLASKEVESA